MTGTPTRTPDRTTQPGPPGQRPARRILFITGRLQSSADSRAIISLARQVNKAGCKAEVICRGGSLANVYPSAEASQASEDDPPISISRALARNLGGYLSLRSLVRRAREIDPDIIHVQGAELAGVGARLARRVRKPYVLSIGDFVDPGQSVSRSRRFIKKVVVASDAVRVDLVNRIGLPRELIEVVSDGVDMAHYPERAARLGGPRVPVVGTIDRLVESKGQEYFVRAAHLLAVRGRNVHFVIAGEGPDRKWVQNLVSELDLAGRVTFAREPVDQFEVLKAIDILVVPALREALGLPVIEAMASGIPVIATSAGGVFSLIENGKTGVLVPKKDPDAIARQVGYFLDHPDLAAELGRQGRERVAESFNVETFARRMFAIYEGILGDAAEAVRVDL